MRGSDLRRKQILTTGLLVCESGRSAGVRETPESESLNNSLEKNNLGRFSEFLRQGKHALLMGPGQIVLQAELAMSWDETAQ